MSQLFPYFQFEVQGEQALSDDFAALEDKIGRQFALKALRAGSKPILAAIGSAPEYDDQTGLLRSSDKAAAGTGDRDGITSVLIRWLTTVGTFLQIGVSSALQKAKLSKLLLSRYAGNTNAKYRTYYARFVEFGHQPSGWYAKQANAEPVPAHSFARTSFDATVDTAAEIAEESLADQISSALE